MTPRRRRPLRSVPDRPGRAVVYIRVSALKDRGGSDFHSPDVQMSACRRAMATRGLHEVAVIDDDIDVSGGDFSRKGIDRVRAMADDGRLDVLVVYDTSRFGRDVLESLLFLRELSDRGVTVICAAEGIDTSTDAGRSMLINMLNVAEIRRREIGRAWSGVIARRAEEGHHHGRPLGYRKVNRRLEIDPELGPVIAQAWKDYAAGKPVADVARTVAQARGTAVDPANLKKIFRRPVYLGHVATSHGDIIRRDAHPALIDQTTYDLVQLRLVRDASTPSRHLNPTWALVGLTYGDCGHRLQRQPRREHGDLVHRLACNMGPGSGVVEGCKGIGMPRMQRVEDEVLRQVRGYVRLLRTDDTARAWRLARQRTTEIETGEARERLDQVTEGIGKLAKRWALGEIADDEYQRPAAELRAEAQALRQQLAMLGAPERQPDAAQTASAAESLLSLWSDMDAGQRNRALRVVVDRVVVARAAFWREPERDRVTVEWL